MQKTDSSGLDQGGKAEIGFWQIQKNILKIEPKEFPKRLGVESEREDKDDSKSFYTKRRIMFAFIEVLWEEQVWDGRFWN